MCGNRSSRKTSGSGCVLGASFQESSVPSRSSLTTICCADATRRCLLRGGGRHLAQAQRLSISMADKANTTVCSPEALIGRCDSGRAPCEKTNTVASSDVRHARPREARRARRLPPARLIHKVSPLLLPCIPSPKSMRAAVLCATSQKKCASPHMKEESYTSIQDTALDIHTDCTCRLQNTPGTTRVR